MRKSCRIQIIGNNRKEYDYYKNLNGANVTIVNFNNIRITSSLFPSTIVKFNYIKQLYKSINELLSF